MDPYDSPSTFRRLFSPSTHRQNVPAPSPLKAAIGPTPQRDGKALGLFDMLSESGGSAPTPSAKKQTDTLAAGFRTPSKPKTITTIPEAPEEEEEESSKLSRTPASETKQFYLANLFATPTTMRYAAMVEAEDEKEAASEGLPPQQSTAADESQRSNPSGTPSFLRRSNSGRYPPPSGNEGSGLSPIASRKPRQFAGRGLSHLVKGLREMEEERMDDELDMLREIEAEQEEANFQIPESQPLDNGKPYKKKGQKRTTRRVIMRPVLSKPKPQEPAPVLDESSEDELARVPETQVQEVPPEIEEEDNAEDGADDEVASLHTMSGGESEVETEPGSDDDPEYDEEPKPTRPKSFSERIKEAVGLSKLKSQETPAAPKAAPAPAQEEKQKPGRPRKVNPQAHANYRAIKIGNRGGKGNGRFRRR